MKGKPIEQMSVPEMIEELQNRRAYDQVLGPEMDKQGRKIEQLQHENAALRMVASNQIIALMLGSGMFPHPQQTGEDN